MTTHKVVFSMTRLPSSIHHSDSAAARFLPTVQNFAPFELALGF